MRTYAQVLAASALLVAICPVAQARTFRRSSNIALRRRLHVNTLITEPGTMELEWSSLYSFTSGNFSMPSTVKYTPEGRSILWGRTEYSFSFDSVSSAVAGGERSTQFSDRLSMNATAVVFDGAKVDIAVAPQATFFLRDESGARLGAAVIARYDVGRDSLGLTASRSAATVASSTNPAGTWDFGAGYGHNFGKITPHCNLVYERSTGMERIVSAFAGVEYQLTEKLAVDVSGQRFGLIGGGIDRQIVVGLTMNLGKLHR